jgi:hypothetical protein
MPRWSVLFVLKFILFLHYTVVIYGDINLQGGRGNFSRYPYEGRPNISASARACCLGTKYPRTHRLTTQDSTPEAMPTLESMGWNGIEFSGTLRSAAGRLGPGPLISYVELVE